MAKSSNSHAKMLMLVLALSVLVPVSLFTPNSVVRAREPVSSQTPIKGLNVIVQKDSGDTSSREMQTDAEGSFTVGDLLPGSYSVSLVCKAKCQSMNDLSAGKIQFTLTATSENGRVREPVFSQQEGDRRKLFVGIKFAFEITGGKNEAKRIKGIVSLLK